MPLSTIRTRTCPKALLPAICRWMPNCAVATHRALAAQGGARQSARAVDGERRAVPESRHHPAAPQRERAQHREPRRPRRALPSERHARQPSLPGSPARWRLVLDDKSAPRARRAPARRPRSPAPPARSAGTPATPARQSPATTSPRRWPRASSPAAISDATTKSAPSGSTNANSADGSFPGGRNGARADGRTRERRASHAIARIEDSFVAVNPG